jgi:hypothetical protein
LDQVEIGRTMSSYKPRPQARYLVDRMTNSEKTLLEAISKLYEKFDSYDKRLTSLGSNVSKVQAQVGLSICSIQALQKEQILLVKAMQGSSNSGHQGATESDGLVGTSPLPQTQSPPASSTPPQHGHSVNSGNTPLPAPHTHAGQCSGRTDLETRRNWMPKIEFPRFDGSDVRIWLDKCFAYFQLYQIPSDFRVTAASLHMVDKASHWFQTYKHYPGNHTWEHFVLAIYREFEVNTHRIKIMELLNLKQTGTVEDYKNHVDQLVYHIMLYDNSISETMLVSQFLLGLKEELRQPEEMHLPNTLFQAATLASVQEHLSERSRPQIKKSLILKSDNKSTFTTNELWKARQLKEYRRANHLYFKCGEKYTLAHKCAGPQGGLNLLEHTAVDGGEFLSKDLLEATKSS